jgi:RimJ/RimL family protein N-acetyltransferase
MICIERTHDMELVRSIITHPKIYPHVTDDESPKVEDFKPIDSELIIHALVKDDDEVLGIWTLTPNNAATCEIHTCLLPNAWGYRGKQAAKIMLTWVWDNTSFVRIITNVPDSNRLALMFAKSVGMEQFGVNTKSFLKNGTLEDQIMLGISKGETPCQ